MLSDLMAESCHQLGLNTSQIRNALTGYNKSFCCLYGSRFGPWTKSQIGLDPLVFNLWAGQAEGKSLVGLEKHFGLMISMSDTAQIEHVLSTGT